MHDSRKWRLWIYQPAEELLLHGKGKGPWHRRKIQSNGYSMHDCEPHLESLNETCVAVL